MLRQRDSLSLAEQLNREWRSTGLNFRIMLVGESGLGKTTFTRALLRPYVPEHLLDQRMQSSDGPVLSRTVGIQEITHSVENDGFPVELEVIDCPGYGDSIDSTEWIDSILSYVKRRFEAHYDALPAGSSTAASKDGLVHCCLYFIAAHRLKGIDIEFMKRLQGHVNLVPIIAKADTMTLAERDAFRRLCLGELKKAGIELFQLHEDGFAGVPLPPPADRSASAASALNGATTASEESDNNKENAPATTTGVFGTPPKLPAPSAPKAIATTQPPPFAVCASEDGTRAYPWGTCSVEDPTHSDLSTLRRMLFASSMVAAKRATLQLYEAVYAKGRREREAAKSAREARALARERLAARAIVLSAIFATCWPVAKALHPDLAAKATKAVSDAVERLKQPRELLSRAADAAVELVGSIIERAQRRSVTVAAV